MRVHILGCALVLFVMSGCAGQTPPSPKKDSFEAPMSVEIKDEISDGSSLTVVAMLSPAKALDSRVVAVRLRVLQGPSIVSEQVYSLATLLGRPEGQYLYPGRFYEITPSVPATTFSDYQIELLWGLDAIEALGEDAPYELTLEITSVEYKTDSCDSPDGEAPCGARVQALVEVVNTGARECRTLELSAALTPETLQDSSESDENVDLSETIVENGQSITIKNADIGPGKTRHVRLTFKDSLPYDLIGSVVPHVRFLRCR